MTPDDAWRGEQPPAQRVAVVGAGSWGTALALHAARAGHDVTLWGRDPERMAALAATRMNERYLPGFELPGSITPTADASVCLADADIVLSVVPSNHLATIWRPLASRVPDRAHVVSATKGIDEATGRRMTEVLAEVLGGRVASLSALSGPSFARELAASHPTAIALGCDDAPAACAIQTSLSWGPVRIYTNTDLIGVELGGALKNIIAIAAGIAEGLGFGSNSTAALVCRGLKEMVALAAPMGAQMSTLMGLSGLGDLVLTCTGPLSRNRTLGVRIGAGETLNEATEGMTMVVEGAVTVRSTRRLAASGGVDLPITDEVYAVLYESKPPARAMGDLLARDLGQEWTV